MSLSVCCPISILPRPAFVSGTGRNGIPFYPFAPWGFTENELRPAIKQKLAQHGGAVYTLVKGEMQNKIFTDFVLAFYEKRKASMLVPNYIARKDAQWIARGLHISESVVPEE